jgi:hypothetical protein
MRTARHCLSSLLVVTACRHCSSSLSMLTARHCLSSLLVVAAHAHCPSLLVVTACRHCLSSLLLLPSPRSTGIPIALSQMRAGKREEELQLIISRLKREMAIDKMQAAPQVF